MANREQIVEETLGLIAQAQAGIWDDSGGSKKLLSERTRATATGRGVKTIW